VPGAAEASLRAFGLRLPEGHRLVSLAKEPDLRRPMGDFNARPCPTFLVQGGDLKPSYPRITIEGYAAWTREDGLPFDPWIRLHATAAPWRSGRDGPDWQCPKAASTSWRVEPILSRSIARRTRGSTPTRTSGSSIRSESGLSCGAAAPGRPCPDHPDDERRRPKGQPPSFPLSVSHAPLVPSPAHGGRARGRSRPT
jgi:hypothetical protein